MTGPSAKVLEAVRERVTFPNWSVAEVAAEPTEAQGFAMIALKVAHDPALGLDRSVCLRDVVNALAGRFTGHGGDTSWRSAADFIEREFGGGS